MVSVGGKICVSCKGRLWCGRSKCPLLESRRFFENKPQLFSKREFYGLSPSSAFVGWKGYPRVRTAPLTIPEEVENPIIYDNPAEWTYLNVEQILSFRLSLLRPFKVLKVIDARDPPYFLLDLQDIVLSKRPVHLEVRLKKKPAVKLEFGATLEPMGPSAPVEKVLLGENPYVPWSILRIIEDDLKASELLSLLYRKGVDVYRLSKILSLGLAGKERRKRLVPTRWSITAVDSVLSEINIEKIRKFEEISDPMVFESHLFDNHFFILLYPSSWFFEQVEAWAPGTPWYVGKDFVIVSDREGYFGRTSYAENVGGAYYAARLAVTDYLVKIRKQAGVIVLREVREGYFAPLGVWQIRENVREAMRKGPTLKGDLQEILRYIDSKTRVPLDRWLEHSYYLRFLISQQKITDFIQNSQKKT